MERLRWRIGLSTSLRLYSAYRHHVHTTKAHTPSRECMPAGRGRAPGPAHKTEPLSRHATCTSARLSVRAETRAPPSSSPLSTTARTYSLGAPGSAHARGRPSGPAAVGGRGVEKEQDGSRWGPRPVSPASHPLPPTRELAQVLRHQVGTILRQRGERTAKGPATSKVTILPLSIP